MKIEFGTMVAACKRFHAGMSKRNVMLRGLYTTVLITLGTVTAVLGGLGIGWVVESVFGHKALLPVFIFGIGWATITFVMWVSEGED